MRGCGFTFSAESFPPRSSYHEDHWKRGYRRSGGPLHLLLTLFIGRPLLELILDEEMEASACCLAHSPEQH